jgi:histidinol-phosphate aminotransferase
MSLVAARAALEDCAWMKANVAKVRVDRDQLVVDLRNLGFRVLASEANFVFAESPAISGREVYQELRIRGILVRYFPTSSLAGGVRITVGTREEHGALLSALRSFVAQ